jgi:hypothetical protein
VGGEGGVPGQARKPGGELGRALLGLCWGPAGNAVGPPTQQMTYLIGLTCPLRAPFRVPPVPAWLRTTHLRPA